MEEAIGLEDAVRAEELLWDNKFAEAEQILAVRKAKTPRHAVHYAESVLVQSFLTGDNGDIVKAAERIKEARALAEQHLKFYERGQLPTDVTLASGLEGAAKANAMADLWLDARLCYSDAIMLNAVLKTLNGSKVKGVLQLRKSWKAYEWTLEHFVTQKHDRKLSEELLRCLRFGCGFFYFIISIIPTKYLKFAQFAGFHADRTLGLQYIREVAEQGRLRKPFATIMLLFHCLVVPRGLSDVTELLAEADRVLKTTLVRYPNGTAWHIMASMSSRKQLNIADGLEHCRIALETARALGREPMALAYEYGAVHVMMLKWQQAAALLEQLLDKPGFRVRGTCALQIAACYVMSGQRDRAIEMWKRLPTLTSKSTTIDHYILTMAQRYQQNGGHFAAFEMLYVRRDLAKMKSVMPEALALIDNCARAAGILTAENKLVPAATTTRIVAADQQQQQQQQTQGSQSAKAVFSKGLKAFKSMASTIAGKKDGELDFTNDNRAAYLLLKGAMLKSLRAINDPEAVACLEDVLKMQGVLVEKWYLAYAYYELCESRFYSGDVQGAAAALKKCIACKDFLWEDPLKMRIRVTADQLKRGSAGTDRMAMAPGATVVAAVEIDDDDGEVVTASPSPAPSPTVTPTPVAAPSPISPAPDVMPKPATS